MITFFCLFWGGSKDKGWCHLQEEGGVLRYMKVGGGRMSLPICPWVCHVTDKLNTPSISSQLGKTGFPHMATYLLIVFLFGTIPDTQFLVKEVHASPRRRMERSTLETINGLKTFSSKWPLLAPTVTAVWFPMTWAATIVMASHCVGFTFPVHDTTLDVRAHVNIVFD